MDSAKKNFFNNNEVESECINFRLSLPFDVRLYQEGENEEKFYESLKIFMSQMGGGIEAVEGWMLNVGKKRRQ